LKSRAPYQVVPKPTLFHAQCAIKRKADIPCVDLGFDFDLDHQGRFYISLDAVTDLALSAGFPTPGELDEAEKRAAAAQAEMEQMQAELEELREFKKAAEYTMAQFGKKVRRKPGPPSKKELAEQEKEAAVG
jgi:hypothetical protein